MSQNPNNSSARKEVNKILSDHFDKKSNLLNPPRQERPTASYTPRGAFKSHYGPPKKVSTEETKNKLEELDKVTQGKIHEKTEDLPDWLKNRERQYADKIIKEGTKEDLRDVPKSMFLDENAQDKTIENKIEQPQPSQDIQTQKSAFVDIPSNEPDLYSQYIKERSVDSSVEQEHALEQPEHDLYGQYLEERDAPTIEPKEPEQSRDYEEPDLYKQYLEEREKSDSNSEPEKGHDQQKEHEFDDRS